MERELWPALYRRIQETAKDIQQKYVQHQPGVVVAVYFWAVIHEHHPAWACQEENWAGVADRPRKLPRLVPKRKSDPGFVRAGWLKTRSRAMMTKFRCSK
jgi:hypothetical protein